MTRFSKQKQLFLDVLEKLKNFQKSSGELETFGVDLTEKNFYIGQSPFLSSISCIILKEAKNTKPFDSIIQAHVKFIQNLQNSNLLWYKFWYGHPNQTSFAQLPYDLDDTSVVNQLFYLTNEKNIPPNFLAENVNKNQQIETWWKPTFKYCLNHIEETTPLLKHFLAYPVFLYKENGVPMASYYDTEIIVRLHVYTYLEMTNHNYHFNEEMLPISVNEIESALSSSLHYFNPSVYCFALARFNHYSKKVKAELAGFEKSILALIEKWMTNPKKAGDVLLLFLSLSYLRSLTDDEMSHVLKKIEEGTWEQTPILYCVGNKKFSNYHQYYSLSINYAVVLRLLEKYT